MRRPDLSLSRTLPLPPLPPQPKIQPALEEGDTIAIGPTGIRIVRSRPVAVPPPRPPRSAAEPLTLECPCLFCGGRLRKAHTPVRLVRDGRVVTLPRVPAWVCIRCEQPYFEPHVVERVRGMLAAHAEPRRA
jgi:YgiT-type zinc finger domain-containing protein